MNLRYFLLLLIFGISCGLFYSPQRWKTWKYPILIIFVGVMIVADDRFALSLPLMRRLLLDFLGFGSFLAAVFVGGLIKGAWENRPR
jgi:hypothetical protein